MDGILKKKYRQRGDIVTRKIAGEVILVPVRGDIADMQRIFTFDSVSEYIWDCLDGETSLKEILSGIIDTFDVSEEDAESDLVDFIVSLEDAGLIERG